MRNRILLLMIVILAFTANVYSVEFETSTGEEDVVLMSTDGEINLGDSLSKTVEQRFVVVKDQALQEKVNKIGQSIAAVCDRQDLIYHFKVIDERSKDRPVINAFALPGGYVYVFKDLCDETTSDDELAGVIAHEVGHIVARHSVKRMQAGIGCNVLLILASQTQTDSGGAGKVYDALNALMSAYSREDELFADKLSIKYVKKAGYDPEAVPAFLTKLLELEKKEPERRYISERSHPYLSIRIATARREASGKMNFVDYINIPTSTRK